MAPLRKPKLPKPLPNGFILTDTEKKQWRLGKIIGQGGFGLIYLASQDLSKPVEPDTNFVIKLEYHENGPLFSELKFYQRAAKPESTFPLVQGCQSDADEGRCPAGFPPLPAAAPTDHLDQVCSVNDKLEKPTDTPDQVQKWKRRRRMDFLGIPTYWGSGLAECNDLRYRFMVLDRLGSDLQKVFDSNEGRLKKTTVLHLGQVLLDVLEYIHEHGYVHADIKAANLLLGYTDTKKIYLADYGLSYRYSPDGVHKEYKENPKKAHNGTIEYTSIDAHKGVDPSRRGDLQILGFCLLHWLCGSLPWDTSLEDPSQVQEVKGRLMENLPDSVQQLPGIGDSADELADLLTYVRTLDYQDKPDYQYLKDILANGVKERQERLEFSIPVGESATGVADHHNKEKLKVDRARGSFKATPKADETVQEEIKFKQGLAGTQLMKVPSHQKENGILLSVRRSQRLTSVKNYKENDNGGAIDQQKQEVAKPRPIPACYIRGPPIGPRAQSKQKTKSKKTTRRTDGQPITCTEERIHPQRRKHAFTNCDTRTQAHTGYREGRVERLPCYRVDCSHQQRSDSKVQEAGPTQWTGLWYSCLLIGALLFLGAVLAFKLFLKNTTNS